MVNGIVLMFLMYLTMLVFLGRRYWGRPKLPVFWPGVRAKPSNVLIIVNLCHSMDIYTS